MRSFDKWEWLDYRDVEQTVGHAGTRSNIGIVAPLSCIANGYQEGFLLDVAIVGIDVVGHRVILGKDLDGTARIVDRPSALLLSKLLTHHGVKSDACRTEEDVSVDITEINHLAVSDPHNLERTRQLKRNLNVTRQSIARTHRDNAESR